MSEQDDERGLEELERQLDAAFATTRPRPGFQDELWRRLDRRRSRRSVWSRPWGGVAAYAASGLATLLVIGLAAFVVTHPPALGGPRGTSSSASAPSVATQPGLARPGAGATLPRRLPVPAAAGVVELGAGGVLSPLPLESVGLVYAPATPAPFSESAEVYALAPGSGPRPGSIIEVDEVPAALPATTYPTVQPGVAVSEAAVRASAVSQPTPRSTARLTQVRLVYVSVAAGAGGYLEPAYLFTGTIELGGQTQPVQVLLPALPDSALG